MRSGALVAVLAGIALLAGAPCAAAGPAGGLPARLIAGGVLVDWPPTPQPEVPPGTLVQVRVHAVRGQRRHPFARLTLWRAPGGGRPRHLVVRRRLRSGTFRVRLSRKAGVRYVLALDVGGDHERAVLRTVAPRIGPPCVGLDPPGAVLAGELRLDRPAAAPGGRVTVTLANTGTACMVSGLGYRWERLVDGAWQPLPLGGPVPDVAVITRPGATAVTYATVPADAVLGRYRIVKTASSMFRTLPSLRASPPAPPAELTLTAELDVVVF